MPTYSEARKTILDHVTPLGVELVKLPAAGGRILAEALVAPWDMPLWDNSAMDGFALRAEDCQGDERLRLAGYLPAGETPTTAVTAGTAVKIMTGAPIPAGANAVVPIEEAEEEDGWVVVPKPVPPRQHIRFRGEDVKAGTEIIPAGTLLRPAAISMLASCGQLLVPLFRLPRVAILATGDELLEVGEPLAPGKIINSNSMALAAAVRETGAEPIILGIARDNRESHLAMMAEGLKADLFITSAGVSSGDRDLVRSVLTELGVTPVFWKIDIKPGRPTAFGTKDGKAVFSLPGNPVSSLVTFEEFVRPALLKMMGHRKLFRPSIKAVLQEEVKKKPGRLHLLRVMVTAENGGYRAQLAGDQNTGILKTMLLANGLALLLADQSLFRAGTEVEVHLLDRSFEMGDE